MELVTGSSICPRRTTALGLSVHLAFSALSAAAEGDARRTEQVGRIAHPQLVESSGIIASRRHPDLFWTHSDGSRPTLYGIRRDGTTAAEVAIEGATFEDWEDIAIDGANNLFLADTGNNKRNRREIGIYRVIEPDPGNSRALVSRKWVLRYPGEAFDSEGLFVWQDTGYLVSKVTDDRKAEIFGFALTNPVSTQTLQFVARLDVESPVTAADISPDGRYLALVAKSGPLVFSIDGNVAQAGRLKPARVKFRHDSMEGCCFVSGGLLTCAETREIYFFSEEAFGLRFN